jgi:hypothetical protein
LLLAVGGDEPFGGHRLIVASRQSHAKRIATDGAQIHTDDASYDLCASEFICGHSFWLAFRMAS